MERVDTSESEEPGPVHDCRMQDRSAHLAVDPVDVSSRMDTSSESSSSDKKGKRTVKTIAGKEKTKSGGKKKRLPLLKRKPETQRIPTSDDSDGASASSGISPESARIKQARALAGKRNSATTSKAQQRSSSGSSGEESSQAEGLGQQHRPVSSGVFSYVSWLVQHRLSAQERERLHGKSPLTVGSMCSGMGTEDFGLRALHSAMLTCGQDGFEVVSTFKAESDPRKAEFLRRHAAPSTQIFSDNSALASTMPVNVQGQQVERPLCKILVCGIVCVDISGLTRNPKPVSGHGKSGVALQGLLESMRAIRLEDRPDLICLECVARLGQHRHVDPDNRTGTKYVTDELGKLGYVGDWCLVRPRDFFLPQSRPRVYSIHLKRADFSEASKAARQKNIEDAFQILKWTQTAGAEKLEVVLESVPVSQPHGKASKRGTSGQARTDPKSADRKWPAAHNKYAEQHGLLLSDRYPPPDFVSAAGHLMSPRALDSSWLKLAVACKKANKDWKDVLVVLPHCYSIHFASVRPEIFPCVTPSHKYVILQKGQGRMATALSILAVQGVQQEEVRSFDLAKEDDALLCDLGGNAFTANIIIAFVIAGALVM